MRSIQWTVRLGMALVWLSAGTLALAQQPGPPQPVSAAGGMQMLVPAYFYPVAGSPWNRLNSMARRFPRRITAIGNPFSGPGLFFDPTYDLTFKAFRASGGSLLGYVHTSYGQRPIGQVLADIDLWLQWYAIDGVFVDEMDNTVGAHEAYYQAIYQHVQAHLPAGAVVGNPGVATAPSYLLLNDQPVSSTLCVFEHGVGSTTWQAPAWMSAHAPRHFCALAYKVDAGGWQSSVDHAWQEGCGWVFVTDDDLPNPWDTLPPYFESMAAYLATRYP